MQNQRMYVVSIVLRAIFCSKFNYSGVTLMKPSYVSHFKFSFLSKKPYNYNTVQQKCIRTHHVWTLCTCKLSSWLPLPLPAYLQFMTMKVFRKQKTFRSPTKILESPPDCFYRSFLCAKYLKCCFISILGMSDRIHLKKLIKFITLSLPHAKN